jgi:hypothetical protein
LDVKTVCPSHKIPAIVSYQSIGATVDRRFKHHLILQITQLRTPEKCSSTGSAKMAKPADSRSRSTMGNL